MGSESRQSFRKLMEPFAWNYILEKDLDEEDDSSIDKDDSVQSCVNLHPPHHRP
jgi:hypothetical protein